MRFKSLDMVEKYGSDASTTHGLSNRWSNGYAKRNIRPKLDHAMDAI